MSLFTTRDGTHVYYKDWGSGPVGATLKICKGGSHALGDTSRDELNADLLAFLKN